MTETQTQEEMLRRVSKHMDEGEAAAQGCYVFRLEDGIGSQDMRAAVVTPRITRQTFAKSGIRIRIHHGGQAGFDSNGNIVIHMAKTTAQDTPAEAIGMAVKALLAASRQDSGE